MWHIREGRLWRFTLDMLGALFLFLVGAVASAQVTPGAFHRATHSHNDYYQNKPLIDALESGMGSIEADIYYVELPFTDTDGEERALREMYIAHDWDEVEGNAVGFARTKGTLADLYLNPLWDVFLETGDVYPEGTLLLHADFKTDTETTWPVLESMLRNYPGLFTAFDLESETIIPGPVTVYTNEEPGSDLLNEYGVVHSTADGRFGDIFDSDSWESDEYAEKSWRMPIVSSNFKSYIDIEQIFDYELSAEEIEEQYGDEFPELTANDLPDALTKNGWELADRLIDDDVITVSDYLQSQLEEADRLGVENDHLMRFWASPDAEWFWELVRPLESVMILTDHPREVSDFLSDENDDGDASDVESRFVRLTKGSDWDLVSSETLDFPTGHPQGMTRVGNEFFLSSVEIETRPEMYDGTRDGYDRSAGEGTGLLFRMSLDGELADTLELGDGDMYHPGGIDYDGENIWVPVAEYRPDSHSIIYRVDPESLEAVEVFRFPDHIGGLSYDPDTGNLHGVSWGSRRLYTWELDDNLELVDADADPESLMAPNKQHYVDYQDCQYVGNSRMLCSGLSTYRMDSDSPAFPLGGIELVDLTSQTPVFQLPILLFTEGETERVMTQNPFYVETAGEGLRFYFIPEDDESKLYVYEAVF